MSKNHPVEQEELMAYLDGELPADQAVAAAAHLEQCPECRKLAGDLRGVSVAMRSWEVEPGSGTAPSMPVAKPVRRIPWIPAFPSWSYALAGGLALGLVLLVAVRRPAGRPNGESEPLIALERSSMWAAKQTVAAAPAPPGSGFADTTPASAPPKTERTAVTELAPMIAYKASLSIYITDFAKSRQSLEAILQRHHGYFGELAINAANASSRSLTATLRVPAPELQATLAEMRQLGRVLSESQSGEEVTAQAIDLDARLANARNTEKRLTDLLRDRTGRLADVLAVENDISRVRGEIETMDAERKNLAKRVAFATITVTLSEEYQAQFQVSQTSIGGRFRNAAVEGFQSMLDGVLGITLLLVGWAPTLLVLTAVLFFPVRFAWRRFRAARQR